MNKFRELTVEEQQNVNGGLFWFFVAPVLVVGGIGMGIALLGCLFTSCTQQVKDNLDKMRR